MIVSKGEKEERKLHYGDRAIRFSIDLSVERSDKSLIEEGLIPPNKIFTYLTVFRKGNGVWTLKQKFYDGSTLAYDSSDFTDNYLMKRRFIDILFTNSPQTGVTNPVLLIEWTEG